jgi:hypothetical protein
MQCGMGGHQRGTADVAGVAEHPLARDKLSETAYDVRPLGPADQGERPTTQCLPGQAPPRWHRHPVGSADLSCHALNPAALLASCPHHGAESRALR